MQLVRLFIITGFFLCSVGQAHAAKEKDYLKPHDVHRVMDRLLEYHVEVREVSPEILQRSYAVYLDQFDPNKIYLTEEEVRPFLQPSPVKLHGALNEYAQADLATYAELNTLIQKGIERSREWRRPLTAEVKEQIVTQGIPEAVKKRNPNKQWAASVDALRERQQTALAQFARRQLKNSAKQRNLDKTLTNAWALYNKRANNQENPYLYRDNRGYVLSRAEQENLLVMRTVKALAKSLDSHTAYYSASEAYQMRMQLMQGFTGIGVVLEDSVGGVKVARIIKGGPVDGSGAVKVDDRIVEIDGHSIATDSFEEVMDKLRGPRGSQVVIGVEREEEEQGHVQGPFNVTLTRSPIALDDSGMEATYEYFGDGIIGVVRLDSFYEGANGVSSERDVRHAIREFKKKGNLAGLVLDMRGNLGGFLSQAVKVAGLFITNGVIAVSKYSDGKEVMFRDIEGHAYYDGPMVILTSKMSASAAEIVAQALQDYGQAVVVGDHRTYGKGSIQHQTITDENADLFFKVTVGRYYTVSGRSTQITGVQADIVVPSIISAEPLGEEHLEYPLHADQIAPAYDDTLEDLSPGVRQWFSKYYLPTLQEKKTIWTDNLETLRKNSEHRLKTNRNFQIFLGTIESEKNAEEVHSSTDAKAPSCYGAEDLQLHESISILKDMIILQSQY